MVVAGIPPFTGENDKETFALTLKGTIKWAHLGECSPTLRDLVKLPPSLDETPQSRCADDTCTGPGHLARIAPAFMLKVLWCCSSTQEPSSERESATAGVIRAQ